MARLLRSSNESTVTITSIKITGGSTPTSPTPSAGMVYFDSTAKTLKVYNGTTWELLNELAFGGDQHLYTSAADVNYRVHIFRSSGTFSVSDSALVVEWLVVAGGGSGGSHHGGGGGAGGFRTGNAHTLSVGTYTVVVGAGGASIESATSVSQTGSKGGDSSFGSIVATGGGGGAGYGQASSDGGSGGGGGYDQQHGGVVATHTHISGETSRAVSGDTTGKQGGHGGQGATSGSAARSGGGGGASEVGYAGHGTYPQRGGLGEDQVFNFTEMTAGEDNLSDHFLEAVNVGVNYGGVQYLAGGGGGYSGSAGGLGGGGGGTAGASTTATDAPANSGGGGGGINNNTNCHSGAGGSGIVVIRYAI